MLVDHFKSIQGAMDASMNWAWSRISLIYMSMVGFWFKYDYLDLIRWIVDVEHVIGFKLDVVQILPN